MLASSALIGVRAVPSVRRRHAAGRPRPTVSQGGLPALERRAPWGLRRRGTYSKVRGSRGLIRGGPSGRASPRTPVGARLAARRRAPGNILQRMHAARLRGLVAEDAGRPGRRKPGPATAARKLVLACLAKIEPPGQSGVGDDHTGRPRAKEAKPASPPPVVGGRQGASNAGRLLLNPEGPPRGFSPGRWRVQAKPLDSQGCRLTLHATADGLSRGAAKQENPPLHLSQLNRVPRDLHV